MSFFKTRHEDTVGARPHELHELDEPDSSQLLRNAQQEMTLLFQELRCEYKRWNEGKCKDMTLLQNLRTQLISSDRQVAELEERCLAERGVQFGGVS